MPTRVPNDRSSDALDEKEPADKNYPLPLQVENIDRELINSILSGKELYFVKLETLCTAYFQHPKLMQLARLTHGNDGEGIGNACFYIVLGTKTAYDELLKAPTTTKNSNPFKSIFIAQSPDYTTLFVNFLKEMFENNETDVLEKTYKRDDILTISLFYRDYAKKTTGRVLNYDYLIGVASIVIDEELTCLLAWLGIAAKMPCKKPACSVTKELDNMRGAFNIGTFLVCTCQWIKSLSVQRWVPVICQVFELETKGPINFYKKNYFIRLLRDHPLVHLQYSRRRNHVIDDDDQLHWYALFQPLQYLTMFEVLEKVDDNSIGLIWDRATFFFLHQPMFDFSQNSILPTLENCFGDLFKTKQTFNLNKNLLDPLDDDVMDSSKLIETILETGEHPKIRTIIFQYEANEVSKESHIFLLASKIYFGTASYHYIIRQFFYFVYRSLSKLKSTHGFFNTVMPVMVQVIVLRTFSDNDYNFPDLIENNGLPNQLEQIIDGKSGKTLKMYYKKMLALFSESFLKPTFKGADTDLYILKDFFKKSFGIVNIQSNDHHPFEANYNRQWEIHVNRSNDDSFSPTIEYIYPFMEYIRTIRATPGDDNAVETIWLARVNSNELCILSNDNGKEEENIFQLPKWIGGILLGQNNDVEEQWISPLIAEDDVMQTTLSEKAGKLDFIVERVEKEASIEDVLKVFYQYVSHRKWKKFRKLVAVEGGTVVENGIESEIGPLFEIADLTNAKLNQDMIMPIFRILDPWQEVYFSGNLAVRYRLGFKELLTYRKNTWLDANAIDGFLSILNDPVLGFSSQCYILDTTECMKMILYQEWINKFLKNLPKECNLILICVYVESHYVVVEIEKPSQIDTKIIVKIADSDMTDIEFQTVVDEIRKAGVDLIACSFNAHLPIDYQEASNVVRQDSIYDCGVRCLQRIYFWKRFGHPTEIPTEYNYLKNCDIFRVFALGEILKFNRKYLSPLVYFEKPIHTSIGLKYFTTLLAGNEAEHDSEDVTGAADLLHLSTLEKTQTETEEQSSPSQDKKLNETEIPPSKIQATTNDEIEAELLIEDIPTEAAQPPNAQDSNEDTFLSKSQATPNAEVVAELINEGIVDEDLPSSNFQESNEEASLPASTSLNDTSQMETKDSEIDTEVQKTKTSIPSHAHKSLSAKALLLQNAALSDNATESEEEADGTESEEEYENEDGDNDNDDSTNDDFTKDGKDQNKNENAASGESNKNKVTIKVPMKHKVVRKLNARTGKFNEFRLRDDKGNYIMVPAEPSPTTDNATTTRQQRSSITVKKRKVGDARIKKVVGKKKNKKIDKENERKRKLATRNAENTRKKQLSSINNEIDRWENWHDVADGLSEVDIFSNDPNYFIDKKLPANTSASIKKDINRLKTKLYDPEQCDPALAIRHVNSKFEDVLNKTRERHAAAVALLADMEKGSARYRKQQNVIAKLHEIIRFHEYHAQTQAELLPFDSVYAIRTKMDTTGLQKEYYAVAKRPDGSFKEKPITRDWVTRNVEKEFLDRLAQAEQEKGWVLFAEEDAATKLIEDSNDLQELLRGESLQPIYEYKPNDDDDRIHCVRVAVDFKTPYRKLIPNSIKWAIMTEKHSAKNSLTKKDPWMNKDENGNISRIYWDVRETLLKHAIGEVLFDLIFSSVQTTWRAEYENYGKPYLKPIFILDDNPHVDFIPDSVRYLDPYDFRKESYLKEKPRLFRPEYCGIMSHRQYYYFDLRDISTKYYVNVSTKQISGLCYNPITKQWTGLEKYREKGRNGKGPKFKKVDLDEDWVTTNIEKPIIKAAIQKAKADETRFVKLPVGLGRPVQTSKEIRKNPKIAYPQYGENTCIFSSICSALFYLKYEDVALQIHEYQKTIMKDDMFVECFENLMGKITQFIHDKSYKEFRRVCCIQKIKHCENFDLIAEATAKPNILHHVVLISQDGSENHAISVVHNWIFDGNYSNARILSQENLNDTCGDSLFFGIAAGYKYIFNE